MHPNDLRDLLQRQPFRPFRLMLTNQTTYEIRHPELAVVTRTLVRLGYPATNTPLPAAERIIGIALLHIVQYELLPAPVDVGSN